MCTDGHSGLSGLGGARRLIDISETQHENACAAIVRPTFARQCL
jgi:hypothetical protein